MRVCDVRKRHDGVCMCVLIEVHPVMAEIEYNTCVRHEGKSLLVISGMEIYR